MRIRVEHNTPKGEMTNSAHVQIINQETGEILGGVQRLNIVYDAYDKLPKAYLEVINFASLSCDIEVEHINVVAFGPDHKRIKDMSREELIQALKREAALRYQECQKTPFLKNNKW